MNLTKQLNTTYGYCTRITYHYYIVGTIIHKRQTSSVVKHN